MTTASEAPLGEVTVTQRLLAKAPSRGEHRALVGGPADPACSYTELAATVQAAAAGLAWRGLQPRDVIGVYVPDAACYVLAAHAIRAAGGVPTPVATGLTVPEIAGQLADCGARMLLTAPPLASTALAAADRSWVRQVISFGEAPGTVPGGTGSTAVPAFGAPSAGGKTESSSARAAAAVGGRDDGSLASNRAVTWSSRAGSPVPG